MVQHHKYNYSDLENMMPWERQIVVTLLSGLIKEETERLRMEKIERESNRGRRKRK